jgi:glycosyltransferase involved in cell wall biosynthesis
MDGQQRVNACPSGAGQAGYCVLQISKVRMNPYVRLLREALVEVGIDCSLADGLSPRLARSWRFDVLHLHWLELLYTSPHLGRSLRRLVAVLTGLVSAKAKGAKVAYTVHNLNPHEQAFPLLNRIANRAVFAMADALHVHDEEARQAVAQTYGRRDGVYVIPHGSYIGAYPNSCTTREARERLGLADDAFVYLSLGQVRRYKGIEDLVAAFGQLGDDAAELVIAGNVHDAAYGKELAQLTQGRTGIHTWFQYVPDAEVQYFMNACDVCVLPYRDVTTSGGAILAFSFGRPIIAPALGGFSELLGDGRGIVYNPEAKEGLLGALQQARSLDVADAGRKALAWASEHAWSALAPRFARVYADVLGIGK